MSRSKIFLIGLLALISTNLLAKDPISWTLNQTFPNSVYTGESYNVLYTFTNQLPSTLVNPLIISINVSSGEFIINDQCSGKKLHPNESCTVAITLNATTPGFKTVSLVIIEGYDNNQVPLPRLTTFSYPDMDHTLGGTLSGLEPLRTITLKVSIGGQELTLNSNGAFTFQNQIDEGTSYSVGIETQPVGQICTVTNGSGVMGSTNVTNITVTCDSPHTLGGTLSGLLFFRTITLKESSGQRELTLNSNGAFTFPNPIYEGTPYSVDVKTQPANQNCTVTNGSGVMGSTNVTNITVNCVTDPSYTYGGTVSGLTGFSPVTLVDTINTISMNVLENGTFQFQQALYEGRDYNVIVSNPPTDQQCDVTNGSGIMGSANVTNITVNCYLNAWTIGGTLSGLDTVNRQSVKILHQEVSESLVLTSNGNFTFFVKVKQGAPYTVIIETQPDTQTCTLMNGVGVMGTADVTNITVSCANNLYTLGGTLSGLDTVNSQTVKLSDGGSQELTLSSNGAFTFKNPIAQGSPYNVTVLTQPAGQSCTVSNRNGIMGGAPVFDGVITCVTNNSILETSVDELALSVAGLVEYGVPGIPSNPIPNSGQSRIVKITNTSNTPTHNLNIEYPNFPSGTNYSSNCRSTLAANATCEITIIPGSEASSDGNAACTNGTAPLPSTIKISADNVTDSVSTNVFILGYDCIYQEGYIFAFDDTTPTDTSVRGKVASTSNVPKIWSAKESGFNDDEVALYNISELSTPAAAQSIAGQTGVQTTCNGSVDGVCNTHKINIYSQGLIPPVPKDNYAAGYCENLATAYADWYLPAICEASYNSNALATCGDANAPRLQNMRSNLREYNNLNLNLGYTWTSTESSITPKENAWRVLFSQDRSNEVDKASKRSTSGTICVRTFNNK